MKQTAIIIGAGPAGLTAAYEFLHKTDIRPIVIESSGQVGGLAKTIAYKGNHIDIGGHRFFSKSQKVINWWLNILPLQGAPAKDDIILNRPVNLSQNISADPEKIDQVMLSRNRYSRIMAFKRFFDYPFAFSMKLLQALGLVRIIKILFSYLKARLWPLKSERNLEEFFINRFGNELYRTFFKSYTEKVWGMPCSHISPEWGAQRVKGLSIPNAIANAIRKIFKADRSIEQRGIQTSLIEQFMYPKFGPGLMWSTVEKIITDKGATVMLGHEVVGVCHHHEKITAIMVKDKTTGREFKLEGDYFISTMPVKDLVKAMQEPVPAQVRQIAGNLVYRDFITVGLLLKRMRLTNQTKIKTVNNIVPDNWIYIQEPDVKISRLQVFNNWSPYMVSNPDHIWLGLEYICQEADALWEKSEQEFIDFAVGELVKLQIIAAEDVLDHVHIKVPKAYPAYLGAYKDFNQIRAYLDGFDNLFLIGRNGMHRYNNQDHSMLTAMAVVDNIAAGKTSKDNIWSVNTEQEFHEERK